MTGSGTEVKGLVNAPIPPPPPPRSRWAPPPPTTPSKVASAVWFQTDGDDRLVKGDCTCNFHQQNQLRQGPCEHILALRMSFAQRKERLH